MARGDGTIKIPQLTRTWGANRWMKSFDIDPSRYVWQSISTQIL